MRIEFPKSRFSRRVTGGIIVMLLLFTASFVLYQLSREKRYKIELLNTQLQDYNHQLHETLAGAGQPEPAAIDSFLASHPKPGLRLTVVMPGGTVAYDNVHRDVASLPSHLRRKEVEQALSTGTGYDINRTSETLGQDYFYSATRFGNPGYVIRTALPYNLQLAGQLRANHYYLWFATGLLLLLVVMVWRFGMHLDRHIIRLRAFAVRAENGEPLDTPELLSFTDDELGEIAERIIVLYRRLKETRQQQDKLKRELTQNIAHELKTPVASIQGYLDTILSQPQLDEATRTHFLEQSFSQVTRLTSLIADILILNRLDEVGGMQLGDLETVDLGQAVERVMADTDHAARRQGMTWQVAMPTGAVSVLGTEKLVYSIFRNLADNAIAYAGKGAAITLSITQEQDRWKITFADNGAGVPAQHLPRLFERFYRVDKGRSREMGGTGLGLSIVKNSVTAMGGQIAVAGGEGQGLAFIITLPSAAAG